MALKPTALIRKSLQEYADRGIFRGLSEQKSRLGRSHFRFLWLADRPHDFVYDEKNSTLRLVDLLPQVSADSEIYADLRRFMRERTGSPPSVKGRPGRLPKHRLVDPKRAAARWTNRKGNVSLVLTVKNNQFKYGVRKILNLANEAFVFLNNYHVEYMLEHFDIPED
jgi:hypothetical protein